MKCLRCDTNNLDQDEFCANCGFALNHSSHSSTTATVIGSNTPTVVAPLPTGTSASKGSKPRRPPRTMHRLLRWALVILVILVCLASVLNYVRDHVIPVPNPLTPTPSPSLLKGIGVTRAPGDEYTGDEYIGISDGTFAFDTKRPDGDLKSQAAERLKTNDVSGANLLWHQAIDEETNDAEALIYLEDQRIIGSGRPYITFIVVTMLSGTANSYNVGRDDLQGAYVAQKECNSNNTLPNGVGVRLLIANVGDRMMYASQVAEQIKSVVQANPGVVGVMGWPFGSEEAIRKLGQAHIPMVSPTASEDSLRGISPYFFRVAPTNENQVRVGVQYAEQTWDAKKAAVFLDPDDMNSQNLADDFQKQFRADGHRLVDREYYTIGSTDTLPDLIRAALRGQPDLIYFAGYPGDVSAVLNTLPPSGVHVLGTNTIYQFPHVSDFPHASHGYLYFTAFAFPDEWTFLRLGSREPQFFTEYPQNFDPQGMHMIGNPFGYRRANSDVILSYDAMMALLTGSKSALTGSKTSFSREALQQAMEQIKGQGAFQGVSGQISFSNGDPVRKAIVVLHIDANSNTQIDLVQESFLKSS